MQARNEDAKPYSLSQAQEDSIIEAALRILSTRIRTYSNNLTSPDAVKAYLRLHLATQEHESFGVLMLTSQHAVIEDWRPFNGTVSQTSVYPREVVKRALASNAAAVILYHNHPSGVPEPSRADEALTQALKTALATVDIRVLDHLIVGGPTVVSFAERGLV